MGNVSKCDNKDPLLALQKHQKYRTNSVLISENKTGTLSENVKIDPHEYVYQEFPLPLLSTKSPLRRTNTILMAENYNANFVKKIKIDPQEYIHQGTPLPLLLTKTPKHRLNPVFIGENYKANFVEIRQHRPLHHLQKLQKLQKHTTYSVLIDENKNATFVGKRENRPSGIRLSGVNSPSTINKKSINIERTLF